MTRAPRKRAPRAPPARKTAVIVVHGMGEQRPMETLWGLVAALWTSDPAIQGRAPAGVRPTKEVWSKPEGLTGSYELRRVTTDYAVLDGGREKRVDFFEFYWAHLMTGNTVKGVWTWLFGLLFRRPSTVPARLRRYWMLGVTFYVTGALLLALAALHTAKFEVLGHWRFAPAAYLIASAFSFVLGAIGTAWVAPVAGDAARYLSATPDNVDARQKIREAGVNLLTQLHACAHYDRIVILAHSLGAVVAYDVINAAFGRLTEAELKRSHGLGSDALAAMKAVETAAGLLVVDPKSATARATFRTAQRAYQTALRDTPDPPVWLVSDFVTVGSPLSKADVLIARDPKDLEWRKARREAPSCPPWLEVNDPDKQRFRLSYPPRATVRIPHHAAAFAATVWSNIYFPTSWDVVSGDVIAGPCAAQLGPGIRDIELPLEGFGFKHLDYWAHPDATPTSPAIAALRRAVNLALADEATLWGAP